MMSAVSAWDFFLADRVCLSRSHDALRQPRWKMRKVAMMLEGDAVTPTLLSCWYLWASCGNHLDFWVAVIFFVEAKEIETWSWEANHAEATAAATRQGRVKINRIRLSRTGSDCIISMLGVVQPPTSSDLFRSLQYSGSFRMNSTLWRFVPLLLLLGWVDFHVYRFQCKRREQVSTSQAKKQREFVEQAKAAGLRSTWNWHDLRISPDLLADNQGGWYYHSDGIVGHEESCTVWKHAMRSMRCSISKKARRGHNLQAQTSRLCRTSKKKAPKVKRKVRATAGCCSPSLLSAEVWKVWLLMMTMRMTMRMIIIAMRMKMKGEHDCSFDHRLTSIWLTLFHAGRRRRKESADQWSPQKKCGWFLDRHATNSDWPATSDFLPSLAALSTEWFLGSVRSLGFGIYSTMAWGFRWI